MTLIDQLLEHLGNEYMRQSKFNLTVSFRVFVIYQANWVNIIKNILYV